MAAPSNIRPLDRIRGAALASNRKRDGARSSAILGLVLSAAVCITIFAQAHLALGIGAFAVLSSIIALRTRRARRDEPAALPGIDEDVTRRILALPPALPEPVAWRLDRALHAVHHLNEMLEHGPFGDGLPDAEALKRDAAASLSRVVERGEALADLYAVVGPSEAVVRARTAVQREIDDHLIELNGALDAAATYVAVGTSDAAATLRLRAEQLHAIASGIREVDAMKALPPSSE